MVYAKVVNGLKALKNKRPFPARNWILKSDKTYIVPTGFGFSFGAVTLVLLTLSIGFANNLLYFFAFLLVSMALTGMWLTNKNVDSVLVTELNSEFLYALEKNNLSVYVQNKNSATALWDLELSVDSRSTNEMSAEKISEIHGLQKVTLTWTPLKRGFFPWPRLILQSRFPYKMLKAWKYFTKGGSALIYPRRAGITDIPVLQDGISKEGDPDKFQSRGLFRDFRQFQQTDSPLRIDWKKSLKHQKHLVKNFESLNQKKIIIDWESTNFIPNFEDKISQLALWIDICEQKNDLYSLRIKSFATEFGGQDKHYRLCLDKLALLQETEIA